MSKKSFTERCYELLKKVPKGKVTTYKSLARALNTKAYRAVGEAMKKNKHPNTIPCYKVINSNGSLGGYMGSDPKNLKKKIQLLRAEGIEIKNNKIDLDKYLYRGL